MHRIRQAVRSLKNPNYRIYFCCQLVSMTGSWIHTIAQNWLVYKISGSAAMLGLVNFLEMAPAFLMGPFTGVICDKISLRRMLLATQSGLMLCALALALLTRNHDVQVWQVLLCSVITGMINAFDIPAKATFISELVQPQDIPNSIALNSSVYNSARIVGPAAAGFLIALAGESACFAVNAVSFLPLIVGLKLMKLPPKIRELQKTSYLSSIKEGVMFVRCNPTVLKTVIMIFGTCFFGYSYLVLMPVFSANVFHGGASYLGMLMSCVGMGAVMGSLVLASREGSQGFERVISVSSLGFSFLTLCFALSKSLTLSVALLPIIGFFMVNQMAATNSLLQTQVAPGLRGRVMSLYSMAHTGATPLGALIVGRLAQWIGAPATVFTTSVICLSLALWYTRSIRNRPKATISTEEQPRFRAVP